MRRALDPAGAHLRVGTLDRPPGDTVRRFEACVGFLDRLLHDMGEQDLLVGSHLRVGGRIVERAVESLC